MAKSFEVVNGNTYVHWHLVLAYLLGLMILVLALAGCGKSKPATPHLVVKDDNPVHCSDQDRDCWWTSKPQSPKVAVPPTPICTNEMRSDNCKCPDGWEPAIEINTGDSEPLKTAKNVCIPKVKP